MMADGESRKADGSEPSGQMTPEAMVLRTRAFAVRAVRLCRSLPPDPESLNIRRQLGRSASSVAANYRAAQRARSKAEFRAKLGIVEEEADESCHWLENVIELGLFPAVRVEPLLEESRQITAMVVAAIRTARGSTSSTNCNTDESDRPLQEPFDIRHPTSAIPRIGHGFDLHRLEPGLPLVVGGEKLEHDRGCDAHSDGDVVYHAVTDAILGALGQDDIGVLFPDEDAKWKAADSRVFVDEAVRRMREAGYAVGNLDVTVILQRPKLSPHKTAIKANLAGLLGCGAGCVNIKGKTHEKVDALGENRAIACHSVVLLVSSSTIPHV